MSVFALMAGATLALAAEWSAPVDVLHEFKPVVSYKAKFDGELLVIEAALQPGWKTFTMDNAQRAAEKLAGKPSLGIDQPTQIRLGNDVELVGPWHQLPPKDFSKPALRWFSWGYENEARFVAKVRRSGAGPAQIGIRAQACTETVCRNVDLSVLVPAPPGGEERAAIADMSALVAVRPAE